MKCVTETVQVTRGRSYFPRGPHFGQPWCKEQVETTGATSRMQFPEVSPYICATDLRTFTLQLHE